MGQIPADYVPPNELRLQRVDALSEFLDISQRPPGIFDTLGTTKLMLVSIDSYGRLRSSRDQLARPLRGTSFEWSTY